MKKVKKSTFQGWDESRRADYLEQAMNKGVIEDHPKGRLCVKALREVAELKNKEL